MLTESEQKLTLSDLIEARGALAAKNGILESWEWLIGTRMRPALITACGDVLVENLDEGTVSFLDTSAGELLNTTSDMAALEMQLADPSVIDEPFLRPHIVEMCLRAGLNRGANQVYSYSTPLLLGGKVTVENIELTDMEVHCSISGQIAQQLASIPEGTPIASLKIEAPMSPKPWWRFW